MKKYHLLLEAVDCTTEPLASSAGISNLIRNISQYVNTLVLNEPIMVVRKSGIIGITGALVTQSCHIIVHTFLDSREASIDIYSYDQINNDAIKQLFARYFGTNLQSVKNVGTATQAASINQPTQQQMHTQAREEKREEEQECEEHGCSRKATKTWHGRKVCSDHYDYYREKEDEVRNVYPF